ncbi:hypothetical protein LCGC14_0619370 [marine sediment metagenome]|uniref:Uncharacterized protein n=1 Tax=marine sediment metagenome TaxID=412755 RepID=A0A0F9R5C9_9ZZZZ|nr:hypothetical protein [Actinomycetota bacterium]
MLTAQQTRIAKAILEKNPAYKDMLTLFPLFKEVVEALPDTSKVKMNNPMVCDVLNDVIGSAKYLSAFFRDEMPPLNQLHYQKRSIIFK